MSDFEKWFRSLNTNGKTVYFLGNEHKASEMAWNHQQAIIDSLKNQLNNMEACYIERKKQVEAVNAVLMNWQDEYTEYTLQHECTVDAVLRTCIAELEQALRGEP